MTDVISKFEAVGYLRCEACEKPVLPRWQSRITYIGRDPVTKRLVSSVVVTATCSKCRRRLARIDCRSSSEWWDKED